MTPALPPSSRTTRLRPACAFMRQPTAGEPVKREQLEALVGDQPVAQLAGHGQHRDGALGQAGVVDDLGHGEHRERVAADGGLSTIEQPAAMAGATLWAARLSGKLKGLMAGHRADREAPRDAQPADVRRADVERDGLADHALGLLGGEPEGQRAAVRPRRARRGWACPIRA